MDAGTGELTLHAHITGPIPLSRLKWFEEVFLRIVLGCAERGMKEIVTWVDYDNETHSRFAEFFGFEESGFLKLLRMDNGQEFLMKEMFYEIPLDDEDD